MEDLVQDTFANVLARPRLLRNENEVGYLLRAPRNTHANRHRAAARLPPTVPLHETDPGCRADAAAAFDAREVFTAIAAAPKHYRDAVVAVDIGGLSYLQAARHFARARGHDCNSCFSRTPARRQSPESVGRVDGRRSGGGPGRG